LSSNSGLAETRWHDVFNTIDDVQVFRRRKIKVDKPKIIVDKGLYGMRKGYYSTPSETSAIKEGSH
jgi:hypothetical protein